MGFGITGFELENPFVMQAGFSPLPLGGQGNQIYNAGEYVVPVAPRQPSARGKYPPVAVVMLPASGQQESLDTLCLSVVNAKYSQQLKCVNATVKCIGADEKTWGMVKLAKLKVQCLLSSICKGDPYTPLKCAWWVEPRKTRPGDIFPLTDPVFNSITEFLRGTAA
jgi:hypothetical protein